MTARQQRRQAERKARKAANKVQANQPFTAAAPRSTAEPLGIEPQLPRQDYTAIKRAETNRANAQLSTGPRTPEGKAASSQNSFRHGLTGHFAVLPWEDMDRFIELAAQMHEEHQPATITEHSLVERMVQHLWLGQRALHLQNLCFDMDVPLCEQEKLLALYLRYGATHDRAFHKCLAELLKLRAAQHKEDAGFVSQQRQAAAERRKQELHNVRMAAATAKAAAVIAKNTRPASQKTAPAPLPTDKSTALNPVNLPEYPESSTTIRSQAA